MVPPKNFVLYCSSPFSLKSNISRWPMRAPEIVSGT